MTILTQHEVRKSNLLSYDIQSLDTLCAVELLDGEYQREKGGGKMWPLPNKSSIEASACRN